MRKRADEYDGPGIYEIEVSWSGASTVTIEADSLNDAMRKAEMEAEAFDVDLDCAAQWGECVERRTLNDEGELEEYTPSSLEEAYWALTGKRAPTYNVRGVASW